MIARIRNRYIRRTLIVVCIVPAILWYAARVYWIGTAELVKAVRDEVPEAWRGKARR